MMPPGTSLSRWTMAYFAAAVLFLLLAECLMSAGWWRPSLDVTEPRALIVVHAITIGWFSLLMIGALLQFAPVLTGMSLPTDRLSLPCLAGVVIGLGLLFAGFERLDAGSPAAATLMELAVAALLLSLLSLAAMLFLSLWRAAEPHAAAAFVMIGIACLVAAIALGGVFALTLSDAVDQPHLAALIPPMAGFHAGFGLVGWMTFAAIGVTYKLLPMFLLSDDVTHPRFVRISGTLALITLALAAWMRTINSGWAQKAALLAGVLFLGSIAAYAVELVKLYRGRRRKSLELNTLGSIPAFVMMAVSAQAFVFLMAIDTDPAIRQAFAYLFAFGWLTGLGLAQLLKIVPFLTWLEAFGPLLGKRPTPRLGDMIDHRRAAIALTLFYIAVLCAAVAIAIGSDLGFRASALVQTLSTGALALELLRARSLANIAPSAKTAPLRRPALFVAQNQPER